VSDPLTGQLISEPAAAAVIADLATRAADPNQLDPDGRLLGVVVPDGARLQLVDVTAELAKHQPAPERATGTHTASTVQAFIDITARHERGGPDRLGAPHQRRDRRRAQRPRPRAAPGWGDHRVAPGPAQDRGVEALAALDGKLVEQEPFAEHIQDGLTEIAEPAAADLLEVVTDDAGRRRRLLENGVSLRRRQRADASTSRRPTPPPAATATSQHPDRLHARDRPVRRRDARPDRRQAALADPRRQAAIGYKLDNPERCSASRSRRSPSASATSSPAPSTSAARP
jgi:hypothetical protein